MDHTCRWNKQQKQTIGRCEVRGLKNHALTDHTYHLHYYILLMAVVLSSLYYYIYIYLRNQYFHLLDLLLFSPFRTIHHYYWLLATFYKEITVSCSGVGNFCPQPKRFFCTLWKIITLWHQYLFLANLISFPFGSSIICFLCLYKTHELPFLGGSKWKKKLKMSKKYRF